MRIAQRIPMCVRWIALATTLVPIFVPTTLRAETPSGWGPLHLGMTLEQADAIHPDDTVAPCEIEAFDPCLFRDEMAFGRNARVVAQFGPDSGRVEAIVIELREFSKKKGYPCWVVADNVKGNITDAYGLPDCDKMGINCKWHLDGDVGIHVARVCFASQPSSGFINVRFFRSESPR